MEKVQGCTLEKISDSNVLEIVYNQLREILISMRLKTSTEIAGIDGYACADPLIKLCNQSKYPTETEFNNALYSLLKKPGSEFFARMIVRGLGHEHKFVFTHADLTPRNILVHNGKLEAILDWEFAGFYPEYWEYAKALCTVSFDTHWAENIDNVMPQTYYHEAVIMMIFDKHIPVK